jgi:hypothetical protein
VAAEREQWPEIPPGSPRSDRIRSVGAKSLWIDEGQPHPSRSDQVWKDRASVRSKVVPPAANGTPHAAEQDEDESYH